MGILEGDVVGGAGIKASAIWSNKTGIPHRTARKNPREHNILCPYNQESRYKNGT
jgi:hypothetical protein